MQSHLHGTINEVVVTYTQTAEIKRPVGLQYAAMPGMKKTFLFMAVRESVVLQRKFACWCQACLRISAPGATCCADLAGSSPAQLPVPHHHHPVAGEGSAMDSIYRCVECDSDELSWQETRVDREDALVGVDM